MKHTHTETPVIFEPQTTVGKHRSLSMKHTRRHGFTFFTRSNGYIRKKNTVDEHTPCDTRTMNPVFLSSRPQPLNGESRYLPAEPTSILLEIVVCMIPMDYPRGLRVVAWCRPIKIDAVFSAIPEIVGTGV